MHSTDSSASHFPVLYEDPWVLALEKPSGFYTHPPENKNFRMDLKDSFLHHVRHRHGWNLSPVHRLDRATSGVLCFSKDPKTASALCGQFARHEVSKKYLAIVRGWLSQPLRLEKPLKRDTNQTLAKAVTEFNPLIQFEISLPSKNHPTSRYMLLEARPQTGVMHQIRRHLKSLSHPVIGDTQYGDLFHNRIFKNHLVCNGLLLHAVEVEWTHPWTLQKIKIKSQFCPQTSWVKKILTFQQKRNPMDLSVQSEVG